MEGTSGKVLSASKNKFLQVQEDQDKILAPFHNSAHEALLGVADSYECVCRGGMQAESCQDTHRTLVKHFCSHSGTGKHIPSPSQLPLRDTQAKGGKEEL